MIRICTSSDKDKLLALADLNKVVEREYYFDHEFDDDTVYGYFDKDELVAYLTSRTLDLKIDKHILNVSIIKNIVVKDDDQNIKDRLYQAVCDYFDHRELVSLAHFDHTYDLKKLGFSDLYPKDVYTFFKYDFEAVDIGIIKPLEDTEAMLDMYAKMMREFDGYELRDTKYYQKRIEHNKIKGTNFFGIYKNDRLVAYFSLTLNDEVAIIDECIYTDITSLKKMISYALKYTDTVMVKVSRYERLDVVFLNAKKRRVYDILARLDDKDMFSRLYGSDIHNVLEAFTLSDKALWFTD